MKLLTSDWINNNKNDKYNIYWNNREFLWIYIDPERKKKFINLKKKISVLNYMYYHSPSTSNYSELKN